MESSNNALQLCCECEEDKKMSVNKPVVILIETASHLLSITTTNDQKDLRRYLKSLLALSTKASEDSTSYATVSSVLKKHMASFKAIFGKYQTSAFCDDATYIYVKLVKTFQLYDPESIYDLYNDWRVMLPSFRPTSRAETFIDCFKRFKPIVQHLQNAENRWTQLMILAVLRLYTDGLLPQTVRALQSASGCDFLQVIDKIVRLPSDQETQLKSCNNLLTLINSETGSVHSFQPNKIVCNGENYNLADFELWIDWNVCTKVISFMAMSVTSDKSRDICGFASAKELNIVSHRNSLLIRSNWALGTTQDNPKTFTIEISFLFSARVHTAILGSDLRNAFIITFQKEVSPRDSGLTSTYSIEDSQSFYPNNQLGRKGWVTEATNLSSVPSVAHFVELKTRGTNGRGLSSAFANIETNKPTESTRRTKHPMQETVEASTVHKEIQKVQDTPAISNIQSVDVARSTAKTSDYFAQSSQCHDEDNTANRLRKTNAKRRSRQIEAELYRKRIRTEPLKESLFPKTETLSSEEKYSPPAKKAIDVHEQNPKNHENIQLVLVAASDVIQKLTNEPSEAIESQNFDRNYEKVRADKSNETNTEKRERFKIPIREQPVLPKSNRLRKKMFDERVWAQNWSIRNYFETIPTDPTGVEDVDENIPNEENDQMNIDHSYYGSVSDVCGRPAVG